MTQFSKQCSGCLKYLAMDNFEKCSAAKDGHNWRCRACVRAYRASQPGRKEQQARSAMRYRARHREHLRGKRKTEAARARQAAYSKAYRDRQPNNEASAAYTREWRRKNPERWRALKLKSESNHPDRNAARLKLRKRVYSGLIVKPAYCQCCSTPCNPHGHHNDYSKPYDVEWLCRTCHASKHRQMRAKDGRACAS